MKLVTVLGARPQFIKAGALSREIKFRQSRGLDVEEVIIHTGQHYDDNMSEVFFEQLSLPKPRYHLGVSGCSHGEMTGRMLQSIEECLIHEKPDYVVVYGDTNSTLAGALAATKLNIKLVHIEAGLRSHNNIMPEEVNRILTDRVSNHLFCPTQTAIDNLCKEGIEYWGGSVETHLSGDIMLDNALYYSHKLARPNGFPEFDQFVLCTIHRAENVNDKERLDNILFALKEINEFCPVVIPLHPGTKLEIEKYNLELGDLTIIDPQSYLSLLWLINKSSLVMTDSGGVQKEAFFFNKYCLTLREETEWVELLESGANRLVGSDAQVIVSEFKDIIHRAYNVKAGYENLYGDGDSARKILDVLLNSKQNLS